MSCPECLGLKKYKVLVGEDNLLNEYDGWTLERRVCGTCSTQPPDMKSEQPVAHQAPVCGVCLEKYQVSRAMVPATPKSICSYGGLCLEEAIWVCQCDKTNMTHPYQVRRCCFHVVWDSE